MNFLLSLMIFFPVIITLLYFRVIIHELGHYLTGKFLKMKVRGISFGGMNYNIQGTPVFIGPNPLCGAVFIDVRNENAIKQFLMFVSGPILEAIAMSIVVLFAYAFLSLFIAKITFYVLLYGVISALYPEKGTDIRRSYEVVKYGSYID